MKAVRLFGVGDVRVTEEPEPQERDGHTRVRVQAVGLCGSDLHWFTDGGIGDATIGDPVVPGHEMGGVALDGPYAGRVVAIDPALPCERCERCREGNRNLCPHVGFAGHGTVDGGLQQIMSWPTERLFPLPDGCTPDMAAMLEPLGVAVHAWDLGKVGLGDRIAVVGAGPIGLLMLQLALAHHAAAVTVVEPLEHRAAMAQRLGATRVLRPDDAMPAEHDVVFEISGQRAAVREAMELARAGGRVVLAGIPDDDVTTFPAATARRKGLTIAIVRRMRDVYPRTIDLIDRGVVDVAGVVSDRFGLQEASEAFAFAAERRGHKVVIDPSRDGS